MDHRASVRGNHGEEVKGNMRVNDVMTTPARTCYVDTDLGTVAGMMREHDSGFIPVVSAARRVVGLVTDRDICIVAASRRLAPVHISAAQAMSKTVHACFPDDAVGAALASMRQFKVKRLPVVDSSGVIKGVISLNDILRAAVTRRDVPVNEVLATLSDICEPSMATLRNDTHGSVETGGEHEHQLSTGTADALCGTGDPGQGRNGGTAAL